MVAPPPFTHCALTGRVAFLITQSDWASLVSLAQWKRNLRRVTTEEARTADGWCISAWREMTATFGALQASLDRVAGLRALCSAAPAPMQRLTAVAEAADV